MLLPDIAPGKRFALPRPPGSADALLLARFAEKERARAKVVAIFTAEPADAQRLADEIPFFAPALRVAVFPDWETLPYDTFSPHEDLISERLATLWRIRRGDVDVVLMPATTALVRLAPPAFMAGYTFHFTTKQRLDEAALKAQLTLAGYTHVSQVVSPGEYAVRGGLIDLFPMGSAVPYRVDLFGDEIDSIRTFDPDTQRSLYPVPEVRLLPGPRVPDGRAVAQRVPGALARALRGRPDQGAPLQGHRRRHRHRRHRVLPAALLRRDGDRLRLPRRRGDARAARRDRRGAAALLGRHARAPSLLPARPRAADPGARSAVPEARGVLHRVRRARAALAARQERRGASPGRPPCPTSASTAARPSR